MLKAITSDGVYVVGWEAIRGERYLCPECGEDVTFKRGRIVTPHFAHQPNTGCIFGLGESARHQQMKYVIGQLLGALDDVDYELAIIPDRRADVVLVKRRIVVECQASKIKVTEWEQRTKDYNRRGWAVLWVWDFARFGKETDGEYRVPDEIRYCHKQMYGRVYVLSRAGQLYAIHLETIFRPPGDWDEDMGYWPKQLRALLPHDLPLPLTPRRKMSTGGLTLAGFGEPVSWWKRST